MLVSIGSPVHFEEGGDEFGYTQVDAIPLVKVLKDVGSLFRLHNDVASRRVQAGRMRILVVEFNLGGIGFGAAGGWWVRTQQGGDGGEARQAICVGV